MSYDIFDFRGNIGVFLILIMYLLLQINKVSSGPLIYSFLNAIGALLILISLYFKFNLSAFIVCAPGMARSALTGSVPVPFLCGGGIEPLTCYAIDSILEV